MNIKNGLTFLIVGLVLGMLLGYFLYKYRYETILESGWHWDYGQYLDDIAYPDIDDKIQIICNFGNKRNISVAEANADFAKESFVDSFLRVFGLGKIKAGLTFTDKDFDTEGKFIERDKSFLIRKACNINENEASVLLKQNEQNKDSPTLFEIILKK
ncbi:MAG: hypothetical protein G01um101433_920 [Parcubacteria group bacterium Gr01-1014_33]|nr:MAG: hypothetical protein G01um101433_920 [Parcubacteria group bacterium Gr01-1014_33]